MAIVSARTAFSCENAYTALQLHELTCIKLGSPVSIGEHVDFTFEFDSPLGNWMFKCNGEIVRIEDRNGKVGLAVKVFDSVMGSA